jgi:hypothetical protein
MDAERAVICLSQAQGRTTNRPEGPQRGFLPRRLADADPLRAQYTPAETNAEYIRSTTGS